MGIHRVFIESLFGFFRRKILWLAFFLISSLPLYSAFSAGTLSEWEADGAPVRYLLIQSGQEPVDVAELTIVQEHDTDERDKIINGLGLDPYTLGWHRSAQKSFYGLIDEVGGDGKVGSTNIAQVRVVARYGEDWKDIRIPYFFFSGGVFAPEKKQKEWLRGFADRVGPGKVRFMGDVIPSQKEESDAEKTARYRKRMLSFFQLKNSVGEDVGEGFEKAQDGSFDFASNLRVVRYLRQVADEVFQLGSKGGKFAFEFLDSEQAIREFIERSAKNISERDDAKLQKLQEADMHLQQELSFLSVAEQTALRAELRVQLKNYEDKCIDFGELFADVDKQADRDSMKRAIVERLRSLTGLQIQIASHGDMCHSCRGTYWYELEEAHRLEKSLFMAIVQGAVKNLDRVFPTSEDQSGTGGKGKSKRKPGEINTFLDLKEEIERSSDPRSEFFPECRVSVVVSGSRRKEKTDRDFHLHTVLTGNVSLPPREKWWTGIAP